MDGASRDERRVAGLWWSAGEGVGLAVAWTGRGGWLAGRGEGQRRLLHGVASHFPCIALPGVRAETRYWAPATSSSDGQLWRLICNSKVMLRWSRFSGPWGASGCPVKRSS